MSNNDIKPYFALTKDRDNKSIRFDAALRTDKGVIRLEKNIALKRKYVFVIEDWKQSEKGQPFNIVLFTNFEKQLEEIYQELPNEIKEVTTLKDFVKTLAKKADKKDDNEYREIRFAFRKEGDKVKLFTFYNPRTRIDVFSGFGVKIAALRAWYTADLSEALKGVFSPESINQIPKMESRATDEAVYGELEEIGYNVVIEDIIESEMADTTAFINKAVNKALEAEQEELEQKPEQFDILDYQATGSNEITNFLKELASAFKEAR